MSIANNATLFSGVGLTLNRVNVNNNFSATALGLLTASGAIRSSNISLSTIALNAGINVNQPIAAVATSTNATPAITISAMGSIAINGALTGNRVNISTTGNGATSVTLNENITTTGAGNQVSISAFGGANLLRTNGAITADQLSLSFIGAVGQLANRIVTDVNFLNLNGSTASNNVFIREANGVTLGTFGSITVGGAFDLLVDAGQLTFQSASVGGAVTIVKNGNTGSITQNPGGFVSSTNGGVDLRAPDPAVPVVLQGSIASLGTGLLAIMGGTVTAGSLSTGTGGLTVTAMGNVQQGNFANWSTGTGDVIVASVGGSVTLNGNVSTLIRGSVNINALGTLIVGGVSTGATGPNNSIGVVSNNGSVTQRPNTTIMSGSNGNISIAVFDSISLQNVSALGTGLVNATSGSGEITTGAFRSRW